MEEKMLLTILAILAIVAFVIEMLALDKLATDCGLYGPYLTKTLYDEPWMNERK
jgi:hypothetical protein